MGIGLFGKLPQRADFVAFNLPPKILRPLEQWLEAGVAESQDTLGVAWLDAFLVAPIWRVWIGPAVFGQACCGAIMPSVDAVGRYFPLVMLAWAGKGMAPASPLEGADDDWYRHVEARLRGVLQSEQLPGLAELLAELDEPNMAPPYAETSGQSCWWLGGAEQASPDIVVHSGLPPPAFFTKLIRQRDVSAG